MQILSEMEVTVMAQGVVDVYISNELKDKSLMLISNCEGGPANDLHVIPDGTELSLILGETAQNVVVTHSQSTECSFNYIEIDEQTAKTFGLQDGSRVMLTYNAGRNELRLQRLTKNTATGLILANPRKQAAHSIIIGYRLLSKLGIPGQPGMHVTLRKGPLSKRLKLIVPENAYSGHIRLHPGNLRRFGLNAGKSTPLEYDQSSRTLRIATAAPTAVKRRSRPPQSAAPVLPHRSGAVPGASIPGGKPTAKRSRTETASSGGSSSGTAAAGSRRPNKKPGDARRSAGTAARPRKSGSAHGLAAKPARPRQPGMAVVRRRLVAVKPAGASGALLVWDKVKP
ncbi:hypothetical protein [Paenibacillus piri]|uniref:Uncharacterized protein n=1 Tax=Paenibacillus piri TaxID=2547395 RepID=A0A4R5KPS8_9BACL|nr:hypothetical protein [Paenibacillus piri]TDF97723.1 hypothetical protein E1757_14100 [Paenibacillus piri]